MLDPYYRFEWHKGQKSRQHSGHDPLEAVGDARAGIVRQLGDDDNRRVPAGLEDADATRCRCRYAA